MPKMSTVDRQIRRADLTRFIEALRSAAREYQFGIEAGVQVEIYDRTEEYVAGKPFAVLMVDGYRVCER